MNKRTDYEHLKLDNDGCFYWIMNKDVEYYTFKPNTYEIDKITTWFYQQEEEAKQFSLFYKGTALYFTFKGQKYYLSWTFTGNYIHETAKKLREAGCTNIQINWGELD